MERSIFFKAAAGSALVAATSIANFAPANAQTDTNKYFGLVVSGSPSIEVIYYPTDGQVLVRGVRHALKAAGKPSNYFSAVPPGTAAYPDRPLSANEPTAISQNVTPEVAALMKARLQEDYGYWYFYVRNTGHDYFFALQSRVATPTPPIAPALKQ
jgi:hypothetical protein